MIILGLTGGIACGKSTVSSYLQELDLPAAGDVRSFDADEAIRRCDTLLADYDNVLSRLQETSRRLSRSAHENEKLLLEMLQDHTRKYTSIPSPTGGDPPFLLLD